MPLVALRMFPHVHDLAIEEGQVTALLMIVRELDAHRPQRVVPSRTSRKNPIPQAILLGEIAPLLLGTRQVQRGSVWLDGERVGSAAPEPKVFMVSHVEARVG